MPGAAQSPPAGQKRPRIGELLVQRGLLTPAQVDEALLQQSAPGKRLGALLVELGMVDERSLIEALSVQLGVPVADLRQSEPDPEAAARVPEALARSLGVVAVQRVEGTLLIAAGDPGDPRVLDEVGRAVAPDRVQLAIAAPRTSGARSTAPTGRWPASAAWSRPSRRPRPAATPTPGPGW
ncbi:hypothetical protein O1L55_25330 [Streptomyces albulus]|nr:hypothetical protein [Streptomyces noursei]